MILTGKQLIGSTFSAEGSDGFRALNPVANEPLEPFYYEATVNEVDKAFQAAEKAFWIYRQMKPIERAAFLDKIAEEIMALGDELIRRCMQV